MRTHHARLRAALVALLVGSGVLFAIGSTIERHQHSSEAHAAVTLLADADADAVKSPAQASEASGETNEDRSHPGSTRDSSRPAEAKEVGVTILGVDTESVALTVLAVAASLLLALAVWLRRLPRLALLCAMAFGLVFAAGDGRELAHQLDESNIGLAAVAAALIVMHVGVAALAAALYPRRYVVDESAMERPLG